MKIIITEKITEKDILFCKDFLSERVSGVKIDIYKKQKYIISTQKKYKLVFWIPKKLNKTYNIKTLYSLNFLSNYETYNSNIPVEEYLFSYGILTMKDFKEFYKTNNMSGNFGSTMKLFWNKSDMWKTIEKDVKNIKKHVDEFYKNNFKDDEF